MPEEVDPARVYALGNGLHPSDGVSLIPMAAKVDLRKGSDASILIFRRGSIDAALMIANPKLKLIQRIGARADAIDLAAAAKRNIAVSCVPRATLQLTAEHAILLMLALGKKLLDADDAVRGTAGIAIASAPIMMSPTTGPAFRASAGCSARRSESSGSAKSGRSPPGWRAPSARASSIATATGCLPCRKQSSASSTRRSAACSPNPISSRCTRLTFRKTAG